MQNVTEKSVLIAQELQENLSRIDAASAKQLMDAILSKKRVFVAGCGRSLLMMRAFAMRLMHLGLVSYVVGETVTPAIEPDDLLIIGSGSGETGSLVNMAKKAKAVGASLCLITIYPTSTIGSLADLVVHIPGTTSKSQKATGVKSIQPGGNMFEQCLLLYTDALVLTLAEYSALGLTDESMMKRHANLE